MPDATWDRCKAEFEWDGSWRDIHVRGASMADWDAFVQALPGWGYTTEFLLTDEVRALPSSAKPIFDLRASTNPLLRIHLGPVVLCCHFFSADELEFDLDPRAVEGPSEFGEILGFMHKLGSLLGRTVILTPENMPERPRITFDPRAGRPEYHE